MAITPRKRTVRIFDIERLADGSSAPEFRDETLNSLNTPLECIPSEQSLSAQLRIQTAPIHRELEILLGLPGAISSLEEYKVWLVRFFGLYDPLESSLADFRDWNSFGLELQTRNHCSCLIADLASLGTNPIVLPRASRDMLPELPSFAHALGALYVLEGATLGGRIILRDIEARMGTAVSEASRFFGGRGDALGPMWKSFCSAADRFGRERPERRVDVVSGAERTFGSIKAWFAPFRRLEAGRYEK